MCLGLAGRVIGATAEPDVVEVDVAGVVRPINVGLLDAMPAPGAWILIHSGFALEPLTEQEAHDAMAVLGGPGARDLMSERSERRQESADGGTRRRRGAS